MARARTAVMLLLAAPSLPVQAAALAGPGALAAQTPAESDVAESGVAGAAVSGPGENALLPRTSGEGPWIRGGGLAVVGATRLDPAPTGGSLTEVRLEQPILFAHAGADAGPLQLRFHGMLNLEGATMRGGVLTLGTFGEGFVDRRHPHTYLHEAMVSVEAAGVSLAAGKGFVAFGTDDPMDRPPLRYPVNHHWAQVMERAAVTLGVRRGPLVVEGSLFNGDEPESPGQWPSLKRFGDSWSARALVHPMPGVEVQASRAYVASPEHRRGSGPDAVRWSASGRVERGSLYALTEWARTSEADGIFVFGSALGEVGWTRDRHRPYYRLERTERPEEERMLDPFRTQRPHLDDSLLGTSRWTVHTLGWRATARVPGGIRVEPLAELSLGRVTTVGRGVFDPAAYYGDGTVWTMTAGLRIATGRAHRMGRYGVLATEEGEMGHEHE